MLSMDYKTEVTAFIRLRVTTAYPAETNKNRTRNKIIHPQMPNKW